MSHWPSGIFRRAYIRAYAQFIGLDPDAILREFLEVHPDQSDLIVATAAGAAAAEEQYARQAPSMRFRTMFDSALGSLTRLRRSGANDERPAGVDNAGVDNRGLGTDDSGEACYVSEIRGRPA